jgi:KaiC/GvpD/RAD55 family RecA-like ATPase
MKNIQAFLSTLLPVLDGEYVEIRAIHPTIKNQVHRDFYKSVDELIAQKNNLEKFNQDHNIYFGVCPRQIREGGKGAVKCVWTLWADLDFKEYKGGRKEAEDKINSFPFPPTIVVETGNGLHCYWRFREPVEIKDDKNVNHVEQYLKALADVLGADPACAELARVMRLPETFNIKDPDNFKHVSILTLEPERQYNLSDFDLFLVLPVKSNVKSNPLGWIGEAIANIKEGNRNPTFAKLTGKLHSTGWVEDDILALLTPLAQKTGFSLEELSREVKGICARYPSNSFPSSIYKSGEMETNSIPFTVVTLATLISGDEIPIIWTVDQLLAHESVGILAGPAGYGKSWMLIDLAVEIARGGLWMNKFITTQGKVVYIDEESSRALLQRRLNKLLRGKNLPKESLEVHFVIGQSFCLSDEASVNKLRELLKEISPSLVIIDSLIRVHRAEENSAKEMAKVFAVVKTLVRDFKCSFLIADHQRKMTQFVEGQNLLRGSTEKSAFTDSLFTLKKKDECLIVEHSKSRFVEAVPSFLVKIQDPSDDSTQVIYIGEAEQKLFEERLKTVGDFIKSILNDGQWHSRKDLVEKSRLIQISDKQVDIGLKNYVESGIIEREDRKPYSGPGGKQAFYRWKSIEANSSLFQESEMETEMNSIQWSE